MQQTAHRAQRALAGAHEAGLHLHRDHARTEVRQVAGTLRAACAMATSSSVISTPPCATSHEFRCSSRMSTRSSPRLRRRAPARSPVAGRRECGRGTSWTRT
ncbi:hypothetical protein Ddc_23936 [Ditylenchus destructor]|nr:hypothetical protein Ddc_23936 [Ditylenchus destructor]